MVKITCTIMRETQKALQIQQGAIGPEWIPRSQCHLISKKKWIRQDLAWEAEIELQDWIAKRSGLEYEELD